MDSEKFQANMVGRVAEQLKRTGKFEDVISSKTNGIQYLMCKEAGDSQTRVLFAMSNKQTLNFQVLQGLLRAVGTDSVTLGVQSSDASTVYYEVHAGLTPPDIKKLAEEEEDDDPEILE